LISGTVSARTTLPAAQLRPGFFHIQDRHRCTGLRVYLIYRPSCADTVVNPALPYRVALPLDVVPSPIVIIIGPIASQSCSSRTFYSSLVSCLANIWSEQEGLNWRNTAFLARKAEGDPFALLQNLTRQDTSLLRKPTNAPRSSFPRQLKGVVVSRGVCGAAPYFSQKLESENTHLCNEG
jgi:hypothetical protein